MLAVKYCIPMPTGLPTAIAEHSPNIPPYRHTILTCI